MYRFAAMGSDCSLPSECVQAKAKYPGRVNNAMLDNYCELADAGGGGLVEQMCLKALMLGEEYDKAPFETPSPAHTGPGCQSDADCENGLCEDGICTSLSSVSPKWFAVGALGILGALIYYRSRSRSAV